MTERTPTGGHMLVQQRTVLSLGSNLGERMENLQEAIDALFDAPGLTCVALSPVYETAPWGDVEQPDLDTYDHIQPSDMMQASAIIASVVYDAATRPEMLPRKTLPKPKTEPAKPELETKPAASGMK